MQVGMNGIGSRVQIFKDHATVRYIGPVIGQEGTWVGVEWDDPSRGKHDGATGGFKYFECESGLSAGSFVRLEKVSFGCR
jgi:dynactin complex subunit